MPWSPERIENEWLGGTSGTALSIPELVAEFQAVEQTFGPDWIEAQRQPPGAIGPLPTLHIAITGELIRAVSDLEGREHLLERLRAHEPGITAEFLVVAALRSWNPAMMVTLEPIVRVGSGNRAPDLGLALDDERVYVEVSSPQPSSAFDDSAEMLDRLVGQALDATPVGNSSEVYLHGSPKPDEVQPILDSIRRLCDEGGRQTEHFGIATVVVNHSRPGLIVPFDHGGPHVPGIATARVESDEAGPTRHAAVRLAFSDDRAAKMLKKEAAQLPVTHPGIVVFSVSGAVGALATWEGILARRLHPAQHTRVSAIVLIQSGMNSMPEGEAWGHQAIVIENPHATHPCPDWALAPFREWADGEFHSLRRPTAPE